MSSQHPAVKVQAVKVQAAKAQVAKVQAAQVPAAKVLKVPVTQMLKQKKLNNSETRGRAAKRGSSFLPVLTEKFKFVIINTAESPQ